MAHIPVHWIAVGYGFLVALAFAFIKKDVPNLSPLSLHISINIPFGLSILVLWIRQHVGGSFVFGRNAAIAGCIFALAFYLQTVIVTRVPLVTFEGFARGATAMWVVVLSVVMLHQLPTFRQIAGLILVLLGVFLLAKN